MDNTRGLPVLLELLPAGSHAARVKFPKSSMVSPPSPVHQSPAAGSVCLAMGSVEADATVTRTNSDARNRVSMSRELLGDAQSRQKRALGHEDA